tara:strand:+ start:36 stop:299 length:264 start_codon:yes stop_codon:yes gene_type:complete
MSTRTRAEMIVDEFYSTFANRRVDFVVQDLNNNAIANALREAVGSLNIEPDPDRELSIEKHHFIKGQLFVKDAIIHLAEELEKMSND